MEKRRKRNLSGKKVVLESKSKVMLPSFLPFSGLGELGVCSYSSQFFKKSFLPERKREKVLLSLLSIARESEDGGRK